MVERLVAMIRNRLKTATLLCLAFLMTASGTIAYRANAQDDLAGRRGKRSTFMKMKLEYSKNLLEALTTEDYDKIKSNSRALKAMSLAAEWEVPEIPSVQEYLTYFSDFQRLCDDLSKAAERKNLDGVTLSFTQLTINCVKCHQFVRFKKN